MISTEVEKKYCAVQESLEEALEKANSIELSGDKENEMVEQIKRTLEEKNEIFKKEIDELKNSSVWDKLCIAFFGETNAGKSTIIESLRIIYDEETRRAEILAQKNEYCEKLNEHCEEYQKVISSLQEINALLKTKKLRKSNWFLYVIIGIVGIIVGLILANMGIVVW